MKRWMGFAALLLVCASHVAAANYPCSGKKGGVARCDGELFVCNDGSISASKRNCAAEQDLKAGEPRIDNAGQCSCGSGVLCTGPRGGIYCITPAGNKSYKSR
jgi:hypothetical protein